MKKNSEKEIQKTPITTTEEKQSYYFSSQNFKWMLVGFGITVLGFILMMGADANTVDGAYNPNVWNNDIFSFRRIRLAPILVIGGFGVQVYAILKLFPRNKA